MCGMCLTFLKEARQRVLVSSQWVTGYWARQLSVYSGVLSHRSRNIGWSGGLLSAENDFYDLVDAVS